MGYENNAPTAQRGNNKGFKEADGFINVYLPTPQGGRRKLGMMTIHADKEDQADIYNYLKGDDDEATKLRKLVNLMQFDFTLNTPAEAKKFALPE